MAALRYQPARLVRPWPVFLVFFLFFVTVAQAAQVTLSMEPLDSKDEGYRIYQRLTGEKYDYQQPVWSGTETTCTIDNLVEGETYFFVARSFAGSLQSADSNEIEYVPQGGGLVLSGGHIIDDGEPETSSIGTWKISGGANPYGTQSLYSRDPGASYHFSLPSAMPGSHVVAIRWTYYSSRCSAVPVEIYDGDVLVDTVTVDQQQKSGQWNTIGTYSFSDQAKVVVVAESDMCSTCADAVKFTLVITDTDGDGIIDSDDAFPLDGQEWSDADGDGIGDNADTDDDNDGMPDEWETLYGLNRLTDDALKDLDGDGIVNIDEYTDGTNPAKTDTDGDGAEDAADPFPTDANEWSDIDSDGIGDNTDSDDDNDGMPDKWEILNGLDPTLNDALLDNDGDGIFNIDEYNDGTDPNGFNGARPIIIDDGDAGTDSIGVWNVSGGADPYGAQSLYSREAGATYSFEAPLSGRYEVALWWTYYSSRCSEVPVEIYDGNLLLETLSVDQLQEGGRWVVLGTFDFTVSARVVITAQTAGCSTSADAVKFTVVEVPESIIIDDGDAGTDSIGVWNVSGGANPYGDQSLYSREVGATYEYQAPLTGFHTVSLWWSSYSTRCNGVVVEIYNGDSLLDTVTVNQRQNSGMWNELGSYMFSGRAAIVIVSESESCSTAADAVQFESAGF
jgi:hypothetical protein